jgi:FkbH-like protein
VFPSEHHLSHYIKESRNLGVKKHDKNIKVGLLSSFTINGLAETIRVKCDQIKVSCSTYVSSYNQYNQEILNSNSELYQFNPDITFLIIDSKDIFKDLYYFFYEKSPDERRKFVEIRVEEIVNLVNSFIKKSNSKLVISNLPIAVYSPLGIVDSKEYGISQMIIDFNNKLVSLLKDEPSVYVFDFMAFTSKFGEINISKPHNNFIGDIKISFDYLPYLAEEFIGYIKPLLSLNRKCIVLDLDNTLWGGIVGEDGFDNIKLSPEPPGNIYVEFQKHLLALHQRGIILAINSKNNPEDAFKVIREHPNMILHEEHFAAIKINWNNKIQNMKEIAEEINIGLDSMVFLDDDPVNREIMKIALPQVLTIDLPQDPSFYVSVIQSLNDFNVLKMTEEDKKRGEMYLQQKRRNDLKSKTTNLEEFLDKLEIKVTIKKADNSTIPRISQLVLKTNQFNLTTKRYPEEKIRSFVEDSQMLVGCAQVGDKFGDHGLTGVFIVKLSTQKEWHLDSFLLSCRVIGREVEYAIMSFIISEAQRAGVSRILAEFVPTEKNASIKDFLEQCGFERGEKYWVYDISKGFKKPASITLDVK